MSCRLVTAVTAVAVTMSIVSAQPPAFALSNTLGSNMVLQRDNPNTALFGFGSPGAIVTTFFQGQRLQTAIGADTVWRQRLPPIPAGGPYDINGTASTGGEFNLTNVLL